MLWFFANDFEVYWYVCGQHSTAHPQPAAAAPSYSPLVLLWLLHRYEAFTLVLWYVAYILFMTKNEAIFKWVDKKLGVEAEAVIPGEGIDGLLGYLARLLVGPGDAVVTSDGAYPTFNYHVAGYGGVLHKVPYRADAEDPDALVEKARETGAKLIYLANPDNPVVNGE